MQDARCQMQGARHTPCFCSSQLTAHGLEQQYNNPAKSLKTQYFTRHDQLNLAGDDHLPGLCNCHPKLPTVIYNCHLQLSSTTAIHWAATIASIQAPNHSAWSTASSPWHAKQQRHWGSCACSAGAFLRSLVSKRQSLQTCPETKIIDNWQASCAEVGPSNSWHRWGLHNCTLPVQALPWLTANEGIGCFY